MTDETPTDGEAADDGPITPEVVKRGASARKRRVGQGADGPAPDDEPVPAPGRPLRAATGRTFARGCTVLAGLGILVMVNGVFLAADPAGVRCDSARRTVESALDDDEEFNDVDLPEGTDADELDDLDCDVAIELAGQVPTDEDDEPSGDWITEGAIRNYGLVYAGAGVALGVVGFLLLRGRTRPLRTAALVLTVVGVLVLAPAMTLAGLPLGLPMAVYVIFALGFSADAKAMFPPDPNRPGLFRPRPPRAAG